MKVYVPIPAQAPCSPASAALRAEGVEHEREYLPEDDSYGGMFVELWNAGDPFIICEWDVVPYPGAIQSLLECNERWCGFKYPLQGGNIAHSFGLNKYHPEGELPPTTEQVPWWQLDGVVVPALRKRGWRPHIHEPAVAHARKGDND